MTQQKFLQTLTVLSIFSILTVWFSNAVPTEPIGPDDVRTVISTRLNISGYGGQTVLAEAGNVSELEMNATVVTQSWQGFYGNVSGILTLDDANNNTFYDWIMVEPQGEVYASTASSVTWTRIYCFPRYDDANVSGGANGSDPNWSNMEAAYNIQDLDNDGLNETFNRTTHPEFFVGTNNITNSTCPVTHPYTSGALNAGNWYEVLLADNQTNTTVFAAIIEDRDPNAVGDVTGFNGVPYDFQMLVLEDGHPGPSQDATTTYYFWVELD